MPSMASMAHMPSMRHDDKYGTCLASMQMPSTPSMPQVWQVYHTHVKYNEYNKYAKYVADIRLYYTSTILYYILYYNKYAKYVADIRLRTS